jgi:hypothetical protein
MLDESRPDAAIEFPIIDPLHTQLFDEKGKYPLLFRFHRTYEVRWNHRPYTDLFFFSYSTYTKYKVDDDDSKS